MYSSSIQQVYGDYIKTVRSISDSISFLNYLLCTYPGLYGIFESQQVIFVQPGLFVCNNLLPLGQKKLIISLALPRALLQKWPHFTFFSTFCRVCIFLDKFHQQLNQFTQIILRLCRNYMLEKRFTKVNSMNKHLIRNLRLKFLLHMPSPFTK